MNSRYQKFLFFILLLFVSLYLMLSYYSRLATDDYYFIWDIHRVGIWKSIAEHYMEWMGRFSASLIQDLVYKYLGTNQEYYTFYPILNLIVLIAGLYMLISNISNMSSYFNHTISKIQTALTAILFTTLLFFMSFDIGESWFWYCSLPTYLWSVIFLIWGMSFIVSGRANFITYIGLIICFVYIGGAAEFNSAIVGLLLLIVLIIQWKKYRNLSAMMQLSINKKLMVAIVALGISFLVLLIAPGNYLRDGLFPKHQFFYSFFIVAKSIVKFFIFYLPFKIPYIIAFAVPFSFIGNQFSYNCSAKVSMKLFFKKITIGLIFILLIIWFLIAYIMVETGPPRVLFLVSFLISLYASIVCFMLGYTNAITKKQFLIMKPVTLIVGFIIIVFHLVNQFNIAKTYAQASDERIKYIKELNLNLKKDTMIYLKPLPEPGMLYSSEISSDTNHFTNKELRIGYNLKYHVVSEKKVQ